MTEHRRYTRAELASCDGREGRPALVAHGGMVYDLSGSRLWKDGQHMKRHAAGHDLTAEIQAAPHGRDVLERFPVVGIVAEEAGESGLPSWLDGFLERRPFFQRHPHPMTVHFPIAFYIFAPLFAALSALTGVQAFDVTAASCLGAAVAFSLVVIPTGFFTWWVNYGARRMTAVTVKIVLSFVLLLDGAAAFAWRLADPTILSDLRPLSAAWGALVVLLLPMVVIVAWNGAALTFPIRKGTRSRKRREE